MAIDWSRGDISHRLSVFLLDPNNFTVRRQVDGVVKSGEVSFDYYSDTRTSAQISLVSPIGEEPWDGSSAIRLVRTTFDHTGILDESPIGTFFVKPEDDAVTWQDIGDIRTWSLRLMSVLGAADTRVLAKPMAVGKGTKVLSTVKTRFKTHVGHPVTVAGNARDYTFSKAIEYDAGTSELSLILDLLDFAGDRLGVDNYGTPTVNLYRAPSQLGPTFTVDSSDHRTLLIGPVDGGSAKQTVPERVIVTANGSIKVPNGTYKTSGTNSDGTTYRAGDTRYKDEQTTYYASASAKNGHWSTRSVRGYSLDDFRNISDMEPFTQAQAQALANTYLRNQQNNIVESISHSLRYRPLREGDIEQLTHAGETKRWMISSADLDLGTWVWQLDLKGGWK